MIERRPTHRPGTRRGDRERAQNLLGEATTDGIVETVPVALWRRYTQRNIPWPNAARVYNNNNNNIILYGQQHDWIV